MYSGHPSGPNQLAAIQRWPAHTVEPVYSGHPSGPNQLAAIYTEVACSCIQWNLCIVATPQDPTCIAANWLNQLAAIQRWPAHTVEPVYSGDPSGPNLYSSQLVEPVGCYTEVACSYSGTYV